MKGDLVALDPGIQCPGVSVFRDGELYANCFLKLGTFHGNHIQKAASASQAVCDWLYNQQVKPVAVAFEWPQIYNDDSTAVANAVIYMAAMDGYVTSTLQLQGYSQARVVHALSYLPAEIWNSLPKSKTGSAKQSPRGLRVCSRLSTNELAILNDQHDAIDSCGIGLHVLGRLGIRRVYTSA